MAIQLDLQSSQVGVPFSGAYFRVVTAAITRQRGGERSVMIDVVGYAVKPADDDVREVDFRRYHAPYADVVAQTDTDFIAKAYQWVKQQPDMIGAIDV